MKRLISETVIFDYNFYFSDLSKGQYDSFLSLKTIFSCKKFEIRFF